MPPAFPNLAANPSITSPATPQYNCIAWAFQDNSQWWWPRRAYWPSVVDPNTSILEAFETLFAGEGWVETGDASLETGFVKIALYTKNGIVTHASRQLGNGSWTSKLGQNVDMAHQLDELDGPLYGSVFKVYKKQT